MNSLLAYFITFTTYGTWLHGSEAGSVDPFHNSPGAPRLPADDKQVAYERRLMKQPPYSLDANRRSVVLKTIMEVCKHRHWSLFAAHVRTTHVHVVAHARVAPERVMNDFKAYSSRRLTEAGFDSSERNRWTKHGSTRYLWDIVSVEAAIHYVVYEQGEPMAVYENIERTLNSEIGDTSVSE